MWTDKPLRSRRSTHDPAGSERPRSMIRRFVRSCPCTKAPLRVPKNKGHEAMVYLTYIIDFYDALPDITIFMHAHRYSHHNNAILDHDATAMMPNLSSERVIREGYVNMKCSLHPDRPTILDSGLPWSLWRR